MLPRPFTADELPALEEIDATIESTHYLHLNRAIDEQSTTWRLERRELRQRLTEPNRLNDELAFSFKQVIAGIEEGLALCIELDDRPVAALLAMPRADAGTLHVVDLRVDFDFRRQGLGTSLAYAAIGLAREREFRGVTAETRADYFPAISLLRKLQFEPAGLDTHRFTNHDLVKERATLLWCLPLD